MLKRQALYFFVLFCGIFIFAKCSGNLSEQLKDAAKEINKQCPKILDEWTRLDSSAVVGEKSFRYYQTITNGLVITDTMLFKSNLEPGLISLIKTNPDMSFFRENNITMQYWFGDQNDRYIFSIIVNPKDYK